MSSLAKVLDHSVLIFIPDRDAEGQLIDTELAIQWFSIQMCEAFGGVQKRSVDSVWKDGTGRLTHENVCILESYFDSGQLPELFALIMTYTLCLSIKLNQAEIAVRIDDKLILAPSDQANGELNGIKAKIASSHNQSRQSVEKAPYAFLASKKAKRKMSSRGVKEMKVRKT